MSLYALGPNYVSKRDEKIARDKAKKDHEKAVYAAVDARDGMVCRCCSRRMVRSLAVDPRRREHHHVIPRSASGPTETWNIANVCLDCHTAITKHLMTVAGDANGLLTCSVELPSPRTWTSAPPRSDQKGL